MGPSLTEILDAAAIGHFPPPDGATTVVPQVSGRDAGVIAFTAHSGVFTDEDPDWVRSTLAARHLVPDGTPVWSPQAVGNARSIRAFQAAGYRPIGAEALLLVPEAARAAR
ncbi:hypothetical protein [Streptomyces sp. NPDC093093]|uniref:hypothetical protein n=1 Tax=Streptomyces sp. NPDC093093 TaxID=3366025 RepID=UPI003800D16C